MKQSLNERRSNWEKAIEAQQNIWKMFHGKTKLLEEWILNAQQIVTEKNADLNYLIQKPEARYVPLHKTFEAFYKLSFLLSRNSSIM